MMPIKALTTCSGELIKFADTWKTRILLLAATTGSASSTICSLDIVVSNVARFQDVQIAAATSRPCAIHQ